MKLDKEKEILEKIGFMLLVSILPFSFMGLYLYVVPHIPEHVSAEIGIIDTAGIGFINLVLLVLTALKLIDIKSIHIRIWLSCLIPVYFLGIYFMEYKHFLIYYKNFTYKIIFLKEGKEFWTRSKDWEGIISKHSRKFIKIPDKYKKLSIEELNNLISRRNIKVECDMKKERKLERDICSTEDGLQFTHVRIRFEIQKSIVNHPDECYIRITNVKGNEYYELCRKGDLYFMKLVKIDEFGNYSIWNNIVYDKDGLINDLKKFFSK